MPELLTANQAIRPAMVTSGKSPDEVIALCRQLFGESKFSRLTDSQRWTLVCALDPNAIGPYGYTMAPF